MSFTRSCAKCSSDVEVAKAATRYVLCNSCRKTKKGTPWKDTETHVHCRVCGHPAMRLDKHLKAKHQVTKEKYLEAYPDSPIESPQMKIKRKKSPETRKKMSKSRKTFYQSDRGQEFLEHISELFTGEGNPQYGVEKSAETRQKLSESLKGHKKTFTPEGLAKKRKIGKQLAKDFPANDTINNNPEILEKRAQSIAESETVGFRNPDTYQKGYETRKKNGTLVPKKPAHGIAGYRPDLGLTTHSCFEANFLRYLRHKDIKHEYSPLRVQLDERTSFTPDLWLDEPIEELNLEPGWVELKGWKGKDGSFPNKAKVNRFSQYCVIQIFFQSDPEWEHSVPKLAKRIPHWETHKDNVKTRNSSPEDSLLRFYG